MTDEDWSALNRANCDERVAVHLGARGYDLAPLRAGKGRLGAIVEAELPPVAGRRVLHLQCHFGNDSLTLAQRGADVTGLDFSRPAIEAARALAAELELPARFVHSDPSAGDLGHVPVSGPRCGRAVDLAGPPLVAARAQLEGGAGLIAGHLRHPDRAHRLRWPTSKGRSPIRTLATAHL